MSSNVCNIFYFFVILSSHVQKLKKTMQTNSELIDVNGKWFNAMFKRHVDFMQETCTIAKKRQNFFIKLFCKVLLQIYILSIHS